MDKFLGHVLPYSTRSLQRAVETKLDGACADIVGEEWPK